MEKRRTVSVISMMFILLMIIRMIEIIFVKTDQTWIGESILHKICIKYFIIAICCDSVSKKIYTMNLQKGPSQILLYHKRMLI